jgi:uncharacterized protein (DUF2147 family)
MKKFLIVSLILFMVAGLCFAADPAEGWWISVDEKTNKVTAAWHIYVKGGQLFGDIVASPDAGPGTLAATKNRDYKGAGFPYSQDPGQLPVVGTPWIFNMKPVSGKAGEWRDGRIIDPSDGNMSYCKIIFHKADGNKYKVDTLEMRGEVGLGIGRSQYWQKTTEAQAKATK